MATLRDLASELDIPLTAWFSDMMTCLTLSPAGVPDVSIKTEKLLNLKMIHLKPFFVRLNGRLDEPGEIAPRGTV